MVAMKLLTPEQRTKLDPTDDRDFYAFPRLVTHADGAFLDRLTHLYRERLQPNTRILDLMSSWVSHLPEEMEFDHVEGHGLNEEELSQNPRLNHYFWQDLNVNPGLPLADGDFQAVLVALSVQYLQYPEAVFAEIHRVLKPGGIAIASFSNRLFYQKAIAAWRDGTETSRITLVKRYFQSVPGFSQPEIVSHRPALSGFWQRFGLGGADPFYAAIATRR